NRPSRPRPDADAWHSNEVLAHPGIDPPRGANPGTGYRRGAARAGAVARSDRRVALGGDGAVGVPPGRAPPSVPLRLLQLDPGVLDDLPVLRDLRRDVVTELVGSARGRVEAEAGEALLEIVEGDDLLHGLGKLLHDRAWRAARREDPPPGAEVVPFHAGLHEGRQLGHH